MSLEKLKWAAIISFVVAMGGLLAGGFHMSKNLPPYPGEVRTAAGDKLFTKADIMAGQNVYQRYGLMDHGSVWGHGSQRGPEFSATSLHLESEAVREALAGKLYKDSYAGLSEEQRDIVDVRSKKLIRKNRYDASADVLVLTLEQEAALGTVLAHWSRTFQSGDKRYGVLPNTIPTAEERTQLGRFFFWTAWVASTQRPGEAYSYTNNWPPDRDVGNVPSTALYLWTLGGIISLFMVMGLFIFMVHYYNIWYGEPAGAALSDKFISAPLTLSQFRAAKFFLVVVLLLLLQTIFGGLLAHYTVHPSSFYAPIIAKIIPYSWAKSWHLQLAIFWIATTWIASAIYLAPIIGGKEPKAQGLLTHILLGAVVLVAVGSLAGEVAGIKGMLGDWWFWLGHQGWEFLELGRLWQILLFGGLIAWLVIVYRAVGHHLFRGKDEFSGLVGFYVFSAVLVVAFFGFGLFYGKGSHLSMADYWRWFVVHIWVESIFEFFGVGVISLLLVAMGLASARSALKVAYFTAALVFLSGILGTAHHYFWYGGPSLWLAVGSVFSSLEPIPLLGLVVRGMLEYKEVRKRGENFPYKWPMYFLVASSFWNFLGAGVFGFLINLPFVNYFEHGTYLTMNHGHTALFGVYGMLSIGLLLFSWRGMVAGDAWDDRLLKISFWGMNGGLLLMALGTLFPVGIAQAWTSFQQGLWVARDAAFFERGFVMFLGNTRAIPDTIIIVFGVMPLAWFLFKTYPRLKAVKIEEGESVWDRMGIKL